MLKVSVSKTPVSLLRASREATPTSSRAPNLQLPLPPPFSDLKIFLVLPASLFFASGHNRPRILPDPEPPHCPRPSPSPDLPPLPSPSSRASPELARSGSPLVVDAAAWPSSSHPWAPSPPWRGWPGLVVATRGCACGWPGLASAAGGERLSERHVGGCGGTVVLLLGVAGRVWSRGWPGLVIALLGVAGRVWS